MDRSEDQRSLAAGVDRLAGENPVHHASVVERQVEPAELVHRELNHCIAHRWFGDVAVQEYSLSTL